MIKIRVFKDADAVVEIKVSGHAGFVGPEGSDIVCSAVSSLVGYLGILFTEVLPGQAAVSADDGFFSLQTERVDRDSHVQVILNGWVRAVTRLEENYKGWVKVDLRQ